MSENKGINSSIERLEHLRNGGSIPCPFCNAGNISMVSKAVYKCSKCGRGMVGRVNVILDN